MDNNLVEALLSNTARLRGEEAAMRLRAWSEAHPYVDDAPDDDRDFESMWEERMDDSGPPRTWGG